MSVPLRFNDSDGALVRVLLHLQGDEPLDAVLDALADALDHVALPEEAISWVQARLRDGLRELTALALPHLKHPVWAAPGNAAGLDGLITRAAHALYAVDTGPSGDLHHLRHCARAVEHLVEHLIEIGAAPAITPPPLPPQPAARTPEAGPETGCRQWPASTSPSPALGAHPVPYAPLDSPLLATGCSASPFRKDFS
ncbi:hypothetical protein GCM10010329_78310 [Streptomyces spiroverticillatus]|uniref:Uncharacterized protein n=1 Tax=Streptomyces finlayi TaxID=67296 RepID=A0A918X571_9ACTN|nr:hypothetical protein [Streptomyces finlayi]GHA43728.1 hypothetical protein GCM10010329_78310 [Streptomyces spiroverticillatus]GHD13204.1 hypothetical protein GCM10010334_71040 [Streptomyces finlayi]